ncbi:MAG: amidoligase family protein [Prevotella sp.]|nr:amidoligase family protein [Prevotella sp.]
MNTKSFSEQVNEVLNSECGNTAKRNELIKLGLCEHEVRMLLASITPTRTRKGEFDFSKITFGVEIESYNFCRNSLIEAGRENGLTVRSEGYNHEDNRHYFKIVSDSSISGENSNEVVSPILKGKKGMNSLQAMCNALATVDAKVNRSCGLHVHIGAANMSEEHYCRLVRNYQKIEKVIDSFMPTSRRANNSRWCHTLQGIDFSGCTTKRDIARAMNYDRYYKVNAIAYERHKTIEFRQHSGTTDYEKIANWVMFLAHLVEYSFKHEITTCESIEELPFLKESEKEYFINRRAALQ